MNTTTKNTIKGTALTLTTAETRGLIRINPFYNDYVKDAIIDPNAKTYNEACGYAKSSANCTKVNVELTIADMLNVDRINADNDKTKADLQGGDMVIQVKTYHAGNAPEEHKCHIGRARTPEGYIKKYIKNQSFNYILLVGFAPSNNFTGLNGLSPADCLLIDITKKVNRIALGELLDVNDFKYIESGTRSGARFRKGRNGVNFSKNFNIE